MRLYMIYLCFGVSMICATKGQLYGDTEENGLINELAARIKDLEVREQQRENTIHELKDELAELREIGVKPRQYMSQKNGGSSLRGSRLGDEKAVQDVTEQFADRRLRRAASANSINVAFTAGLSHNLLNAPAYHNIAFDKVQTNIGNGYSSRTGVFTAPVSGTYVFFSSILVYNDREIFCRFVVNSVNVANIYARGTDGRLDQGSQLIIVRLQQGDHVSVQNKMDNDAIFGNSDIWSTFSGYLLNL